MHRSPAQFHETFVQLRNLVMLSHWLVLVVTSRPMHGNTNPSRPAVLNPGPSLDDGHPVEKQISVQRLHLCKHR